MKPLIISVCILAFACTTQTTPAPDPEKGKQEVLEVEKAFAAMATKDGVQAAFMQYAADDVVLNRDKKLIRGKEEMQQYYASQTLEDVKLFWEPTFVDVAASGDLAYTYGPYTFSARDSAGNMILDSGYFHTVWKKQATGEWKFVWD